MLVRELKYACVYRYCEKVCRFALGGGVLHSLSTA
jgi:hypothetical protein